MSQLQEYVDSQVRNNNTVQGEISRAFMLKPKKSLTTQTAKEAAATAS